MKNAWKTGWGVAASVVLVLPACEAASLPETRTGPSPSAIRTAPLAAGTDYYDALLQTVHGGLPLDPRQEKAVHMLAGTLGKIEPKESAVTHSGSRLSPAAERALREFAASPRGTAMQPVLARMAEERVVDERP